MERKYKLIKSDSIEVDGCTLYRIQALRDFGNVKAGDLGGYVRGEYNLSHWHSCWIYGNAEVYDWADVFENAKVFGSAKVYGESEVYGDAHVYDNAQVFGTAKVYGDARVGGDMALYDRVDVSSNQ